MFVYLFIILFLVLGALGGKYLFLSCPKCTVKECPECPKCPEFPIPYRLDLYSSKSKYMSSYNDIYSLSVYGNKLTFQKINYNPNNITTISEIVLPENGNHIGVNFYNQLAVYNDKDTEIWTLGPLHQSPGEIPYYSEPIKSAYFIISNSGNLEMHEKYNNELLWSKSTLV